MIINVELSEVELRRLVLARLQELMPDAGLTEKDVDIQVKSKQNYRAEWETAAFRARITKLA
jgi:hypothetical protein